MKCRMRNVLQMIVFTLLFSAKAAVADRTLVWDNSPITLVIPVGEEVRVTFPTDVTIQVPANVSETLTSLAPNQQIVYWNASAAFDKSRIIATSTDNKSVYLIDVAAVQGTPKEHFIIEDADRVLAQQENNLSQQDARQEASNNELADPAEVVLTRFASQSLYAPRRLVPVNADIAPQTLPTFPSDFPLMRSQWGEKYQFTVVGAWAGYGLYITAVMVVNQSATTVAINPGLIHGNFTHITPQHLQLGPKGTLEDRTTLYLISTVPFASAILEDGYGY